MRPLHSPVVGVAALAGGPLFFAEFCDTYITNRFVSSLKLQRRGGIFANAVRSPEGKEILASPVKNDAEHSQLPTQVLRGARSSFYRSWENTHGSLWLGMNFFLPLKCNAITKATGATKLKKFKQYKAEESNNRGNDLEHWRINRALRSPETNDKGSTLFALLPTQ